MSSSDSVIQWCGSFFNILFSSSLNHAIKTPKPDTFDISKDSLPLNCIAAVLKIIYTWHKKAIFSRIMLKSGRDPVRYVISDVHEIITLLTEHWAATASSARLSSDFEINKSNSVVKCGAFLDSRLACRKCLYTGNDLGTVAGLKHAWKSIPSRPDFAQTTLHTQTRNFPLLCWPLLL